MAELSGSTDVRQMVRVWARLLAALVQHWLIVTGANGDPTRSWNKVAETVRTFVSRMLPLGRTGDWESLLADLQRVIANTCRRNPRRRPGTAELLKDPHRLDFRLS